MAEGKSRNKRWRVTSAETSFLEAVFLRTRKPSRATIEHLANSLAVRPRQVQVWFQNRRQRWRKEFSSETAFSPIDADAMQDGDTVHPASLDAIMRQFLGARPQHGGGHGGGSGGSASVGGHSTGASDLREGDDDMDDFELDLDVDEDGARSAGNSHDDRSATDRDAEAEQWRSLSRALNRPGGLSRRAGHATSSSDGAADEEEAAYLNDLASVLDIQPERDGARRAVDVDGDGDGEPDSDEALGKGAGNFGECDDDAESRVQQHAWSRIIGMDWLDGEEEGAAEGAADVAVAAGGTDAGGLAGAAEDVALQFKVGANELATPPPFDAQAQPADAGPQQPDERALRNSSAQQLTQPEGLLVPPSPQPPSAAHAAAQPAPCSAPALPLAQPLYQILKSVSTASESVGCADAMLAAGAASGAALPSAGGGWLLPLSSLAAGKSEASQGNEGFLTPTLRCGNAQAANAAGAHVAGAYAGAGAAGAGQQQQSSAEVHSLVDGTGVGGGSAEQHCAAKAMAIASYLESVCDVLSI